MPKDPAPLTNVYPFARLPLRFLIAALFIVFPIVPNILSATFNSIGFKLLSIPYSNPVAILPNKASSSVTPSSLALCMYSGIACIPLPNIDPKYLPFFMKFSVLDKVDVILERFPILSVRFLAPNTPLAKPEVAPPKPPTPPVIAEDTIISAPTSAN